MPAIIVPTTNEKNLAKPDEGDVFGILWATKNLDLTKKRGSIRLAGRVYEIWNSSDTGGGSLETPVAFVRTNADGTDRWWALTQNATTSTTDGLLYKSTTTDPTSAWAADAIASTPTDAVDNMIIFGKVTTDQLIVARDTDLAKLQNGAWTADWWTNSGQLNQPALAAANPHYIHQFLNMILVPDGNVLHTIDDSNIVTRPRLTFPDEYKIRWIKNDGRFAYIACEHVRGGEGLIFPWNGTSELYDQPITTVSNIPFAGTVDENRRFYVVNNNGQLMRLAGDALEEVARFPFGDTNDIWYLTVADAVRGNVNVAMNPNGMATIDGKVNMLIGSPLSNVYTAPPENFPAGIWEYDDKIGLYQKQSLSLYDGSTDDDWGSSGLSVTGAIEPLRDVNLGRFIAGAEMLSDPTTGKRAIMVEKGKNSVTNRGYLVTSKIEGHQAFASFWKRLQIALSLLQNSTDRIVVKYKTSENVDFSYETASTFFYTITWTDTDTFTIGSTVPKLAVGDEVEVIYGKGAGATAHIASLTSAATSTINLDETIPGASGTARVRIQRWTKLGTISSQTIQEQLMTIAKRSKWIQLKVELRGTDTSPELKELFVDFDPSKKSI